VPALTRQSEGRSISNLLEVQPEGRRIMTVREFQSGARVSAGDRFVDF
jgi:hypothetical protein